MCIDICFICVYKYSICKVVGNTLIYSAFLQFFCLLHSAKCTFLALQFTMVVPQGPIQLCAAPCSSPAFADHPFSSSHHMVCLYWGWLLCGPHSPIKYLQCNQFHPGHQPGLHHSIERPVDHCLTGLHGQCHVGFGIPHPIEVL